MVHKRAGLGTALLRLPAAEGLTRIGGQYLVGPAQRELTAEYDESPFENWQSRGRQLMKHMGLGDTPVSVRMGRRGGAAYFHADPNSSEGIVDMPQQAPLAAFAHELGHASRHKDRSPFWRKHLSSLAHGAAGLSAFGALGGAMLGKRFSGRLAKSLLKNRNVTGKIGKALVSKGVPLLGGAAAGAGVGYSMHYPLIREERGASNSGVKALRELYGEAVANEARGRTQKGERTYELGRLLRSTSGTLAGLL